MNRFHRTVWNEITQTFVAVAETVRARGKSGGASTGEPGSEPAAVSVPKARRMGGGIRPLALEQRFMFDGAAVAGAVADHGAMDAAVKAAQDSVAQQVIKVATLAPVAPESEQEKVAQAGAAEASAAENPVRNVVFIDPSVTDYETLVKDIAADTRVVVLDASREAFQQMAEALAGLSNLDSVQVLSHGGEGNLYIAGRAYWTEGLDAHAAQLQVIGSALKPSGDILFYACDLAAGERGTAFLDTVHRLTGADVAASSDDTGNQAGENWTLEAVTGTIEAANPFAATSVAAFTGRLATQTVTSATDGAAGSLRSTITAATAGDVIVFDPTLKGQTLAMALSTASVLTITKSITIDGDIDGDGIYDVTLSGNIDGSAANTLASTSDARGFTFNVASGAYTVKNLRFDSFYSGGSTTNGPLAVNQGALVVDNCTFTYNAGSSVIQNSAIGNSLTVRDSVFLNNGGTFTTVGQLQGPIRLAQNSGASAVIENVLIANNSYTMNLNGASNNAAFGGIVVTSVGTGDINLTVRNATIANNTFINTSTAYVAPGGGIGIFGATAASTVNVYNTVIVDNAVTNNGTAASASASNGITNSSGASITLTEHGNFKGVTNGTTVAFVNAAAGDFRPKEGATALIGAGDSSNTNYYASSGDIRGLERIRGGALDIGAYEVQWGNGNAAVVDLDTGTSGTGASVTVSAPASGAQVFPALAITEPGDTDGRLLSATVTLTGAQDGSSETIALTPAQISAARSLGIAVVSSNGGQTLMLTGASSLANYQTVLGGVTYYNAAGSVTNGTRTVALSVNDGELSGSAASAIAFPATGPLPTETLDVRNGVVSPGGYGPTLGPELTSGEANSATGHIQVYFTSYATGNQAGEVALMDLSIFGGGSGVAAYNSLAGSTTNYGGLAKDTDNDGNMDADSEETGYMIIKRTDGVAFSLQDLDMIFTGNSRMVLFVEGIKNGVSTGTIQYEHTTNSFSAHDFSSAISNSGYFGNVDYVRVTGSTYADFVLANQQNGSAKFLDTSAVVFRSVAIGEIATTAPAVTGVTSGAADGAYKVGDVISISVGFSEAVNVTGIPQLTLETGATDRVASYASGSGTDTLTFLYTVQAGDTSADLDYVASTALALNGGTIRGAGGADATLTLMAPGTAGSLGANKAIVVDGVAPVITNVTIPQANYPLGTHPNDAHQVGDVVTATITVASDADTLTPISGTIGSFALTNFVRVNSTTYTAQFTVTAGGTAYAAADDIPVSLVMKDSAGNASNTYTTAISQTDDRIDTNAPPVAGQQTPVPTLVDTAAVDTFPIVQGTLAASDPESQPLIYGMNAGVSGSYVVNNVSYDLRSADIFGNASYVNSQTGEYAYVFAAAYLNGMPALSINTSAGYTVSDGNRTVSISVPLSFQGANDAPILSNDGRTLHAIDQGISDAANTGTTVTNVLASAGTATDAEYNPAFVLSGNTTVQGVTILPLGMAITAVDNTNGTWQYKVGNGAWTAIGSVSATNALLLTGADSVRFVPAGGSYAGTDTGGITFLAWDRTSGTAGTKVDTTGANAFSTGAATATIAVDALPTFTATGTPVTFGVGAATGVDLFSNVSASTVEAGQYFSGARITVSGVVDGTEVLTIGNTNVALANGTVALPGLGASGNPATVTVTLSGGVATLVITGLQQNDAAMSTLLDGMAYRNTSAGATLGDRTVSIVGLNDNGGSTGQSVSAAVSATVTVADVTPPAQPSTPDMAAGSDSGGSNSDNITSVRRPVFTGTAEAGSTVTLYDTNGTTVLGSTTADNLGNWSITPTADMAEGAHTVTVKAADAAGNVSIASSALAVTIDATAPTGVSLSTNTVASVNVASPGATVATLSAQDSSAVEYSLVTGDGTNDADNGSFTLVNGTLVTGGASLSAGVYHIYVAATDAAGNVTLVAKTITVVDAPVVTSIVRAGGASGAVAASTTSVHFTITFSESVSGVDLNDFTLTATGTASGGIAGISGSGSTYVVTVTGLAGDGTLRLDLNSSGTGIQNGGTVAIAGGYTAGATYTLDHTAPAMPSVPDMTTSTDTGASNSDNITRNQTPTFTGIAEAGSTVTLYDTNGTTVLGTTTADGSGNWTITSTSLSQGSHTVTAKAVDAAGNVSNASSGLMVTIDTTPPTAPTLALAADTGIAGDSLTNNGAVNVTGLEPGATWEYSTDGGTTWNPGNGTSVILTGDGAKTLSVRQTDAAGNQSQPSATLNFTLDTGLPQQPAAPVLAPVSDSGTAGDGTTNVTTPTFTGTTEPGSTVTLYDTDGTTVLGTTTADAITGAWSITTSTLGDGAHTVAAKVTDPAGNVSVASTGTTVTIDATAPAALTVALAVDTGVQGDGITSNGTVNVSGLEPGATWQYSLDGGTTWTAGIGTSVILTGDGAKTVSVRQIDTAGNPSQPTVLPFTLDTGLPQAPSAPVLASGSDTGIAGDGITRNQTPTFTGTAEAGSTVVLYDTNGTTVLGTTTANNLGQWSITSSTQGDGVHTVTAKVTDPAGNVSVASTGTTVTIDTAATLPTLALAADTGVAGDGLTSNGTVNVTGLEPNATWEYTTDGGTTWTAGTGTSVTLIGDGAKTIGVRQTDAAGNVSQPTTLSFTVDTAAPGAPVIALANDTSTPGDGITADGTVNVSGLEPGATWEYSTDGGQTWTAGSGNSVGLAGNGDKTIVVRQVDAAGNVSAPSGTLSFTVAPDVPPPQAPAPAPEPVQPPAAPLVVSEPSPVSTPTIQFVQSGSGAGAGSGPGLPGDSPIAPNPISGFDTGASGAGLPRPADAPNLFGDGPQRTLTTPAAGGGFRAVILPAAGQGDALVLLRGVADAALVSAVPVTMVIPPDAFGHTNPDAVVALSLTLADGSPLPSWMSFDGKTGKLQVQAPAGFTGELVLKVTARDGQGREVTTTFRVRVGAQGDARPVAEGRAGLSEKLRHAAHARGAHGTLERLRA